MGQGKAKLAPLRNTPSAARGQRLGGKPYLRVAGQQRAHLPGLALQGAQGLLGGWLCPEEQAPQMNEGAGVLGLCGRPAIYHNSRTSGVLDLQQVGGRGCRVRCRLVAREQRLGFGRPGMAAVAPHSLAENGLLLHKRDHWGQDSGAEPLRAKSGHHLRSLRKLPAARMISGCMAPFHMQFCS